jgi:hypothetical protein
VGSARTFGSSDSAVLGVVAPAAAQDSNAKEASEWRTWSML